MKIAGSMNDDQMFRLSLPVLVARKAIVTVSPEERARDRIATERPGTAPRPAWARGLAEGSTDGGPLGTLEPLAPLELAGVGC